MSTAQTTTTGERRQPASLTASGGTRIRREDIARLAHAPRLDAAIARVRSDRARTR